jgi:hypothetical protein
MVSWKASIVGVALEASAAMGVRERTTVLGMVFVGTALGLLHAVRMLTRRDNKRKVLMQRHLPL